MSTVRLFPPEAPRAAPALPLAWLIGLVALAEALGTSVVLVLQHLAGLELPGCRLSGPCAQLAEGTFGSLGPLPLSAVGVAWFGGLLAAWALARRGMPAGLRWLIRAGGAGSLFYLGVMLWERLLCPYCLAVHAMNLLAWGCAEWLPPAAAPAPFARRWPLAFGGVLGLLAAGLWGFERHRESEIAARSAQQIAESIERIADPKADAPAADTAPSQDAPPVQEGAPPEPPRPSPGPSPQVGAVAGATGPGEAAPPAPTPARPLGAFTGRYRRGPESARVRIVLWADYECHDCQQVEGLLAEIVRGRDDVSLSVKQFPFCTDCNARATYNRHPLACRAAEAVEAAGLVGGETAFWGMHDWMLERKAAFDEPELLAQAAALGLDAAQFQQARKGPEVRARIEADIAEAMHFGLDGTPYIFVNGIELRGWRNARQVEQAVLSVAARELPFQTAEADRPRPGVEKFLGRWRSISPAAIPAATHGWPLGPADAHARIVWFGEHQSPQSAAASQAILAALEKYPQTRVEFRHFPLSKRGNPLRSEIQVDAFPLSYDLALLVHAAGRVGGRDGFWKMHRWVLAHQDQIDAGSAARAARELGLDPQAIQRELSNPETAAAVADDVALAAQLGVKFAPAVVVDGRPLEGVVSNPEIIERALQEFRANR